MLAQAGCMAIMPVVIRHFPLSDRLRFALWAHVTRPSKRGDPVTLIPAHLGALFETSGRLRWRGVAPGGSVDVATLPLAGGFFRDAEKECLGVGEELAVGGAAEI